MSNAQTIGDRLNQQKISRRDFLKFCTTLATTMGLSATWLPKIANALENAIRPSVVWLSFQDCMGCTESFSRTHAITLESLLFDYLSLDYHHLLQATAGDRAEAIRQQVLEQDYFLIVEGSIALGNPGYSTVGGVSNVETLYFPRQ